MNKKELKNVFSSVLEDKSVTQPRLLLINPTVARVILTNCIPNYQRTHRTAISKRYANDMRENNWTKGQADMIVINKNGKLDNGQHRLEAVVQSNTSQWFWVLTDADTDLYESLDNGFTRNWTDYIDNNIPYKSTVCTIAPIFNALRLKQPMSRILRGAVDRNVQMTRHQKIKTVNEFKTKLVHYAEYGHRMHSVTQHHYTNHYAIFAMLVQELTDAAYLDAFVADFCAPISPNGIIEATRLMMTAFKEFNMSMISQRQFNIQTLLAAYDLYTKEKTAIATNKAQAYIQKNAPIIMDNYNKLIIDDADTDAD